jgi:integrase
MIARNSWQYSTDTQAPTGAEALDAIDGWADVPTQRRRVLASALRALARVEGLPLEAVRLDAVASVAALERASPAAAGVAATTLRGYVGALRFVLRRLGLLAPLRRRPAPVDDPAWAPLLSTLPPGKAFGRLRAFAAWCAAEGIAPAAVQPGTLDAFAEARTATRGGSKARDQARRVATQWNRAQAEIQGWPAVRLGLSGRARQLSFPFAAYPASLQREVEDYLTAIGGGSEGDDLYGGDHKCPHRTVRPATVKARHYGLRRVLWGGVQACIPPASIASLRTVTTPDFVKASLGWHFRRGGNKVGKDLGALAATIASVANYLYLPADEWAVLKPLLAKATPPQQTEITPRNAALLDKLSEPVTRARLLHLPGRLMREATRLREGWTDRAGIGHAPRPVDAAWLAGLAVAIEVLLHAPIRRENLVRLRLGDQLRLARVQRGAWRGTLLIPPDEVKNGRLIEVPLEAASVALIREYLETFRPALKHAATAWLFPGQASPDAPRDAAAFGTAISETVHEHVGVRVHPHAFRAFAGSLILEANPHAIDDVRAVLGHATFVTALAYYRRSSQREAAGRLSDTLARQRRETRLLASASTRHMGGPACRRPRKRA